MHDVQHICMSHTMGQVKKGVYDLITITLFLGGSALHLNNDEEALLVLADIIDGRLVVYLEMSS